MAMLAQAKEAIESGDHKKAQITLANLLKSEPRNVEAWTLLSDIAPSAAQKKKFLLRASRIDPQHAQVVQRMADEVADVSDETVAELPVSSVPLDFVAQAEGNTIPSWLADQDETATRVTPALAEPEVVEPIDTPTWLKDTPDQDWMEKELPSSGEVMWSAKNGEQPEETTSVKETTMPAVAPIKPATSAKPVAKTSGGNEQYVMWGLIALAVIVFLLLIYFSLQQIL